MAGMGDQPRPLRIATAPPALGFDPEQPGSNGEFHRLCYGRLLAYPARRTEDGELVGAPPNLVGSLAERFETSDDGLTVRITLRSGIRSPYGNELTAADVKWSWDRAFGLRDVGKWIALIGSVTRADTVRAVDDRTVEFHLAKPNATLLQQLTRATPAIHDATEARRHTSETDPWAKEWLRKNPAGFGPYQIERSEPWREIVFRANPGWPEPPAIREIRYLVVPGSGRRLYLLRNSEVDLLPRISRDEALAITGAPGVRLSRTVSGAHVALIPHARIAPFDRPEVRRAVAYAVPYDRILGEVCHGLARPWHSMIPTTVPLASEDGWPYRYDPATARRLLESVGLPDGFATELFVDAADDDQRAMAELIRASLADVGIRVRVEPLDSGTYWQGGRYFRPYPLVIWDGHDQVPDPYYALVHDYGPGKMGLTNCGNYENPHYTALLDRIEGEGDPATRADLILTAQRLLVDDCPAIPLVQPDFLSALRDDLTGFYLPPDGFVAAEQLSWRETATPAKASQ